MDQRMARLERGLDMIVAALAERDERTDHNPCACAPPMTDTDPSIGPNTCSATEAFAELDAEFEDDDDDEDEVDDVIDVEVEDVVPETVENPPGWDKGMQELQQMIQKRNPQKLFRQHWCGLTRAAQYNEWRPERREAFDEVFNSIAAHPKFVYQMSAFMRGSRGGNCIGNEAIARVCGQVAGFLTVYQLAAAGR